MEPDNSRARPHWVVMLPGALSAAAAVAIYASTTNVLVSSICLLAGAPALIRGGITLGTASASLDTERTVIASGLISRSSVEIRHEDVASYDCYQSVLGRLLGYGVIGITTRGGHQYWTPPIADHCAFASRLSAYRSRVR